MLRILIGLLLAAAVLTVSATPAEQARARVLETFAQLERNRIPVDPEVINGPWRAPPINRNAYTYTFDEIRDNWDYLMRGLLIAYPSPEYIERLANRYPNLMHEMHYGDADWEQHSLNVLEVWQAFFRGDYRRARDLGIHYGGYAEVPGSFAQILHAIYLTETYEEKQMHLQDVINRVAHFGAAFPFLPGDDDFVDDYVMVRLGVAYAVGRLAEDETVARTLAAGYAPMVINVGAEIMGVAPDHPVVLALNAALDANVIRRVGRAAGRMTFGAQPINAIEQFERAIELVDDMAVLRYEFANSLLYMESSAQTERAIQQLEAAVEFEPAFSMEALDILYAGKRLEEVRAWQASGMSYRAFDRARRNHMREHGINLYSVYHEPFTP